MKSAAAGSAEGFSVEGIGKGPHKAVSYHRFLHDHDHDWKKHQPQASVKPLSSQAASTDVTKVQQASAVDSKSDHSSHFDIVMQVRPAERDMFVTLAVVSTPGSLFEAGESTLRYVRH